MIPTLIFGAGDLGRKVVERLEPWLAQAPEGDSVGTLIHKLGSEASLKEHLGDLLSASRIDRLESLGFEVEGRGVGQGVPVFVVAVIDLADEKAVAEAAQSRRIVAAFAPSTALAIVFGADAVEDATDRAWNLGLEWDAIVPYVAHSAAGGTRTTADLLATSLCLLAVVSQPGANALRDALLRARGSATTPAIVRVDAAMLDSQDSRFLGRISSLVQSRLLRLQFADCESYEPATSYRAELPPDTSTLYDDAEPTRLAQRLLRDVPFRLDPNDGGAGRISLTERQIIVDPYARPRGQWVSSLFQLGQYLDFSRGAEWRRRIENARVATEDKLAERVGAELADLHSLARGPDRVLVWARELLDRLGCPIRIEAATVPDADFGKSIDQLRAVVAGHPPTAALLTRVLILGLLAGSAFWTMGDRLGGGWWAAGGGALTLVVAAALGAQSYETEHRRITGAMRSCISALGARYEAATAINVRSGVEGLIRYLRQRIELELEANKAVCEEAICLADELSSANIAERDEGGSVFLDQLISHDDASEFFETLAIPWDQLQRDAAARGVFRPRTEPETTPPRINAVALGAHVASLLTDKIVDVSLQRQLRFVAEHQGVVENLLSRLGRRVMLGSSGAGAQEQIFFLASPVALHELSAHIVEVSPSAIMQPVNLEILACLRISPAGARVRPS